MKIPITLTKQGCVIGSAELFDCGDELKWIILEMCFDNIRTITHTNKEWKVELENDS